MYREKIGRRDMIKGEKKNAEQRHCFKRNSQSKE